MKQKKSLIRLTALILSYTFMINSFHFVYAEDEDLTNELQGIESQMQDQQNKKANAEAVIGTVSEQLRQVQVELDQATAELKAVQNQRIVVENAIAENTRLLKAAEERLAKRMKIFNKRVRDIYINGRLSYIDVVIGAKDFNDFANRVEILRRIIDSDIALINEIKKERAEIETRKAALEADKAKLVELEKVAQQKQALVEQKKAERQAVLERAMNDREAAMQAYADLQASSNNIRAMLQQRQAARQGSGASQGYVQGSGVFSWPVNGPITSPYGYRTHPIFGTTIYHSGIDIGVDEGTVVHAADSGVIALSGWIDGYGNTVVIDHGNGLSTLYGHNSGLIVSDGQAVSKGQPIAYAGSTGNSTGPHVHFEVRSGGDTVDPMGYL